MNSPWLDRYERQPHDIYLPLSIARTATDGSMGLPDAVEFLTVDDSLGRYIDTVPNEVIPHILRTLEEAPDRPGPVVWVYPFDEYHDLVESGGASGAGTVFFGDWFIRSAINRGAFIFSGYMPDTTTELRVSCPWGAPLFTSHRTLFPEPSGRNAGFLFVVIGEEP